MTDIRSDLWQALHDMSHCDPAIPIEDRVMTLFKQMTWEERASCMAEIKGGPWCASCGSNDPRCQCWNAV